MGKLNKLLCVMFLLACAMLSSCRSACAEQPKDFRLFITPYAWLMSVSGDIGARGYTAKVDAHFTDLTKHLNFAGMLAIDAIAYDRFGFTGNINFAMLGDSSAVRGVSLDSKSSMLLSDAALFYRLGRTSLTDDNSVYAVWDVYGGARIWDVKAKLDIGYGNRKFKVSQRETWVDPLVGAKVWIHLADRWGLEFRGDVGGFGAASDFTWSASALLGYNIWENGRLLLGYRAVGVDYESGSGRNKFEADATLHGPIVGLSFRF